MPDTLDALLRAFRGVAASVAGGPLAAQAQEDVKALEAIALRHAQAAEADARAWLTTRLHPSAPQPGPAGKPAS